MDGIYAGVPYNVVKAGGATNIVIGQQYIRILSAQGADMSILKNIGEQDPEDVMEALFDSIPEKKDGE